MNECFASKWALSQVELLFSAIQMSKRRKRMAFVHSRVQRLNECVHTFAKAYSGYLGCAKCASHWVSNYCVRVLIEKVRSFKIRIFRRNFCLAFNRRYLLRFENITENSTKLSFTFYVSLNFILHFWILVCFLRLKISVLPKIMNIVEWNNFRGFDKTCQLEHARSSKWATISLFSTSKETKK